ncbi:MAG: hypothetical protein HYT80_00910 [Euryarchaeota archaeon]|nr:hypothetical protein [Euryarchaeota archaeon]
MTVDKLGYEAVARKVPVSVGDVSRITIVLKAVEVPVEGYILSQPFNGYINFGQAYFDYYLGWDALDTCSKCEFYAFLQPKPLGMKFEASWQKSVGAPGVSDDIYYMVRKNWNNDTLTSQDNSENTAITSGYWVYGDMPRNMEEADHKQAKDNLNKGMVDKLKIRIGGGFDGVAYEQKVEMWLSFAYVEEFPEDFSAFPKP